MLSRANIFATPIFSIGIADYKEINPPLINKIYELQKTEKGVKKSNILGWQSTDSLNNLEEFAPLKKMINEIATIAIRELGCDKEIILGKSWASVNPKNASNHIHDHPGAFISGAYYLKVPAPVSPVAFFDPRPVKTFLIHEFDRMTDYSLNSITIEPKEGMLLIFPGWLKHSVEPNMSDDDRISLSFNYHIKKDYV